jgi:hypothetical protein
MMAHWLDLWYSVSVNSEPATKQDLSEAVRQVTEKTSQDIAEAVRQVTDILTERIRDSQTELLRGFYEWARPVDVRLRHADELVQRMGWLEERVSKLERGERPSTH